MPIIHHSDYPNAIDKVMTAVLGERETKSLLGQIHPQVHHYELGTYSRLLPSKRDKNKFLVWDRVAPEILELARQDKCELLFDMAIETLPVVTNDWRRELDELYAVVGEQGINPSNIVIANCNPRASEVLAQAARVRGVRPIRALCAEFVFAQYWELLGNAKSTWESAARKPSNLSGYRPIRPFLSLNRKAKLHRLAALIAAIAATGPKGCIYSLLGAGDNLDIETLARQCTKARNMYLPAYSDDKAVNRAAAFVLEHYPRYASEPLDSGTSAGMARTSEPVQLYDATLLSVVGETSFGGPESQLITEKVLKPMMMRQPFIVCADPHGLARVRHLGFKTFGEAIDENYDTIEEPPERFTALHAELRRIGALSQSGLREIRKTLQPAVAHNVRHLRDGFRARFGQLVADEIARLWP